MDVAIIDVRILAEMFKHTHKCIVISEIQIFIFFSFLNNSLFFSFLNNSDFVFVVVSPKNPTVWYQE